MLIADDQQPVLDALRLLLKAQGWRIQTATSTAGVQAAVAEQRLDLVVMDLNYSRDTTSGAEGLELLRWIGREDPCLPVVVMTAWGSVDGAVEAMRLGARDYVEKPWKNDKLVTTLRTQIDLGRALRRSEQLEGENARLRAASAGPEMIASSPAMEPVLELVERVGPSDANVLVTGPHGAGKEVLARALHAASLRADRPLVTVNSGGLGDGVFESELFGHVKGAFTDAKANRVGCFELAHEGTIFLDEIGNMPLSQQAKLLRVLQTGEMRRVGASHTRKIDVRLVSATNVDLHQAVREGRFREDLLYRLNTVEIRLPPLRERGQDIPEFAARFLQRFAARYGRDLVGFTEAAHRALLEHEWPGNVRELEHAIERAVLMARGDRVDLRDLGLRPGAGESSDPASRLESMSLDDAERWLIERALQRCEGNVKKAADELGLSRSALYRRLERHGLGGSG